MQQMGGSIMALKLIGAVLLIFYLIMVMYVLREKP